MKEFNIITENISFISGWYIQESICDGVVDFFNEENYFPVKRGISSSNMVNSKIKNSYDKTISTLTTDKRLLSYFETLSEVMDCYKEKFEWCNMTQEWKIVEHVNIQHYPPLGGYKIFHCERNGKLSTIDRHLVFMTYLNDVTDRGETEFYYQKLKVKPEKGLTLIWPVDWTHTHRGVASPTQEKTIITGWYKFV